MLLFGGGHFRYLDGIGTVINAVAHDNCSVGDAQSCSMDSTAIRLWPCCAAILVSALDRQPNFTFSMFERFDGAGDAPHVATASPPPWSRSACSASTSRSGRIAHPRSRPAPPQRLTSCSSTRPGPGQRRRRVPAAWRTTVETDPGRWRGPVTTSKLFASNRPRLLPVIDTVVKDLLTHPRRSDFYRTLHHHLAVAGHVWHRHLEAVREHADVGSISASSVASTSSSGPPAETTVSR